MSGYADFGLGSSLHVFDDSASPAAPSGSGALPSVPRGGLFISTSTPTGLYRDLADFRCVFEREVGLFGRTGTLASAPVPGRVAHARLSRRASGNPRVATVSGVMRSGSQAQLAIDLRALVGWCARAVAIKSGYDEAASYLLVQPIDVEVEVPDPQMAGQEYALVRLRITAEDARWHAATATVVPFAAATSLPLGQAECDCVVRITGAVTNPTLTLKDAAGTTVASLGLLLALPGVADYVEIDSRRRSIVKSVGGVLSDAVGTLNTGDFFVLDPQHADYLTPAWPTLQVSYSAGTGTAVCTYRPTNW